MFYSKLVAFVATFSFAASAFGAPVHHQMPGTKSGSLPLGESAVLRTAPHAKATSLKHVKATSLKAVPLAFRAARVLQAAGSTVPLSGEYKTVLSSGGPNADGSVTYCVMVERTGGPSETRTGFNRSYSSVAGVSTPNQYVDCELYGPDTGTAEVLRQYIIRLNPYTVTEDFAWAPRMIFGPMAGWGTLDYIFKIPANWHYVTGSAQNVWPYLDAIGGTTIPTLAKAEVVVSHPEDTLNPTYLLFSNISFGAFDPAAIYVHGEGIMYSTTFSIAPNPGAAVPTVPGASAAPTGPSAPAAQRKQAH